VLNINTRMLMASMTAIAAAPVIPAVTDSDRRYAVWPLKQEPDNRGRRAEKDALALAKAETKRQRRAAKRLNAELCGARRASEPTPGSAAGGSEKG